MVNKTKGFKLPSADNKTVDEYRTTLVTLRNELAHIKNLIVRYPVFLLFAGSGYRFETPAEIDEFIEQLEAEIRRYESVSAAS